MKKLVLGLFVIAAMSANAQIEGGKLFVGGSFGFGTSSNKTTAPTAVDNSKTLSFNLMPEVGYMISENLAVGMAIGYYMDKRTSFDVFTGTTGATYDQVSKDGMFIIEPFARYYKSTGDKSSMFAEFALPIGMGSSKSLQMNATGTGTEDASPTKNSSIGTTISVGFNYFLNDRCALEAKWMAIGFESYKMTSVDGAIDPSSGNTVDAVSKITNIGLGLDMTALSIGLKIFI